MTREEAIKQNDELRTTFRGGLVLMTPAVFDLPTWFRGRALCRMSMAQKFMDELHSHGVFVFGGYVFEWWIGEFAGQRSITLSLGHESAGCRMKAAPPRTATPELSEAAS